MLFILLQTNFNTKRRKFNNSQESLNLSEEAEISMENISHYLNSPDENIQLRAIEFYKEKMDALGTDVTTNEIIGNKLVSLCIKFIDTAKEYV